MTNDPRAGSARPASPIPRFRTLAVATPLLIAFVGACSPVSPTITPGGSPGQTTGPAPTATPVTGAIQHPTGAADVILRMEESGGFIPIESLATSAPTFTLYGNGTVVFRNPTATPPDAINGVIRALPFWTVQLDESGIQALLAEAIGPGGLGAAAGPYQGQGADMSTTTFTITADGGTKSVSVSGFLPDLHPNDEVIVAALGRFAERLAGFAAAVGGEQIYVPAAYRGNLMATDQAFGPVISWPWADISPDDFASGENEFFKTRSMSAAELASIGVDGADGGFMGLTLRLEGKLYTFSTRPLLPDEK